MEIHCAQVDMFTAPYSPFLLCQCQYFFTYSSPPVIRSYPESIDMQPAPIRAADKPGNDFFFGIIEDDILKASSSSSTNCISEVVGSALICGNHDSFQFFDVFFFLYPKLFHPKEMICVMENYVPN